MAFSLLLVSLTLGAPIVSGGRTWYKTYEKAWDLPESALLYRGKQPYEYCSYHCDELAARGCTAMTSGVQWDVNDEPMEVCELYAMPYDSLSFRGDGMPAELVHSAEMNDAYHSEVDAYYRLPGAQSDRVMFMETLKADIDHQYGRSEFTLQNGDWRVWAVAAAGGVGLTAVAAAMAWRCNGKGSAEEQEAAGLL